jgi:tRNA threonylcarbamoyl adenosine modification protein YeaZ
MTILALEFSTEQRSVAVVTYGVVRGTAMEIAGRATHAFALIEQALAAAKLEREQIECLAIGLGPGSYTGIRSALALAQGWQLARPVKLLGVSSVECIADEARAKGWFGTVSIVIDAQRNELYRARYEITEIGCREISALKLATVEEVQAYVATGELVIGPEAERWFKTGRVLFPGAGTLGQLAVNRSDFVTGDKLTPIYLREISFVKAPPPRILPLI